MRKWIICFATLGFIGAAAFYSPYVGFNVPYGIECPVCLNITTIHGTPTQRFLRFSLVFGAMNAVLFAAAGAVVLLCVHLVRKKTKKLLAN